MINFDSLTLKIFTEEYASFFEGAKIQKIQQASRTELIFQIRSRGETKKFYINFSPDFHHLCFIDDEGVKLRNISIPKTAPMFCMLLRKYIQNAKILKISAPEYERIFEIYFEYFDEFNEKSLLCLAVELMGKYSNVILYNYDTNVIIGCAHNVSSQKSSERELCGTLPYVYPKKQKKSDLLKTDFTVFKQLINPEMREHSVSSNFYYLTVSLVQDCIDSLAPYSDEKLYNKLINVLNDNHPCIKNDFSKYYTAAFPDTFECSGINEMIDKYFSYHQNKFIINQLKSKINRHIKPQLSRLYSLKEKQEKQLDKINEAEEFKKKADIISANIYALKRGLKSAQLYDFEGNEIFIELDENKTPQENAAKYYNLYKKAKNAYEHAKNMLGETNSEILYFEEMKYFCENTYVIEDLNSLADEIFEDKMPSAGGSVQSIDVFEYEGFKIYAGRNKKQNDYILSKLSSPEDLWFHPLNAAGAHILVKTNKLEPTESVILRAAKIAKEYSAQKNNSKTSIIYTKRRYVKKASQKQAFVTYKNETEIVV